MDIFSHGLWTGALYKAINRKMKTPINVWWGAFWGIFPDLFAFTLPFLWVFGSIVFGNLRLADFSPPHANEPPSPHAWVFTLTSSLYHISHSAVIFAGVFALATLLFRKKFGRMPWELGGWLLHILIDIPTHSYRFFPTPVLWPLSDWKFNGLPWSTPWFLILNYGAIIITYLVLKKINVSNNFH